MRKIFIEGFDQSLVKMFEVEGYVVVNSILKADILCLEGGHDVSPELYHEENTDSSSSLSNDIETFGLIKMAELLEIPIVGICRGHQALCVAQGGSLKQHINGHCQWHNLDTGTVGLESIEFAGMIPVSSSHHQETVPPGRLGYKDILYAEDGTCEVILYRDVNSFGFLD